MCHVIIDQLRYVEGEGLLQFAISVWSLFMMDIISYICKDKK